MDEWETWLLEGLQGQRVLEQYIQISVADRIGRIQN